VPPSMSGILLGVVYATLRPLHHHSCIEVHWLPSGIVGVVTKCHDDTLFFVHNWARYPASHKHKKQEIGGGTYLRSHSTRLKLKFDPAPTISSSLYTRLLTLASCVLTSPDLARVFESRLNDGTLIGVAEAVCRSQMLGAMFALASFFALAAQHFLNASFL
jgi:hypothetical protein